MVPLPLTGDCAEQGALLRHGASPGFGLHERFGAAGGVGSGGSGFRV